MEAQILKVNDATGLVQFTVVDGKDLKQLTERGWILIAVLQEDVVEPVRQPVPLELQKDLNLRLNAPQHHQTMDRNWSSLFHTWDMPVVRVACRYLVGLREGSVLEHLNDKINALEKQINDFLREGMEKTRAVTKLEEELNATKGKLELASKTSSTNFQRVAAAESIQRKLEEDIAKLRSAIGEIRMKEILGR